MSQRIRIKDIAEKAGVSAGTVDRVLHDRGNVAPDVRRKVLEVMKEAGYERNFMASMLAYNRRFRIAALLPDYQADPYWEQPFRGITRAFRSVQHYGISLETHFFGLFDPESFLRQAGEIFRHPPDAVIFAPVFLKESLSLIERCKTHRIPNVMINTYVENDGALCYIGQDSYQSGVLAARLLHFGLNKGETVLLVNLEVGSHNAKHLIDKEQGFRDYFAQFPEQQIEIIKRDFEEFDLKEKMSGFLQELLARYPLLNGIFFTNSRAYWALECLPAETAQRIKVVGFDLVEPNLRHLRRNNIDFLINQNPVQQGYLGIMNIVHHLVFKKPVEPLQFLPLDIVVTENLEYYLKRQEEYELVV
jgi:LacI family transcriptional regulator